MVVGASSSPYFRSSGKTESLIRIDSAALRPEGVYGGMLATSCIRVWILHSRICMHVRKRDGMDGARSALAGRCGPNHTAHTAASAAARSMPSSVHGGRRIVRVGTPPAGARVQGQQHVAPRRAGRWREVARLRACDLNLASKTASDPTPFGADQPPRETNQQQRHSSHGLDTAAGNTCRPHPAGQCGLPPGSSPPRTDGHLCPAFVSDAVMRKRCCYDEIARLGSEESGVHRACAPSCTVLSRPPYLERLTVEFGAARRCRPRLRPAGRSRTRYTCRVAIAPRVGHIGRPPHRPVGGRGQNIRRRRPRRAGGEGGASLRRREDRGRPGHVHGGRRPYVSRMIARFTYTPAPFSRPWPHMSVCMMKRAP
jgi:hypothetical protein